MAEAILAFAILGIALAGLAPFAVTQLRLIHKLETRFQGNPVTRDGQPFLPNQTNPAQTYLLCSVEEPPDAKPVRPGDRHERPKQRR